MNAAALEALAGLSSCASDADFLAAAATLVRETAGATGFSLLVDGAGESGPSIAITTDADLSASATAEAIARLATAPSAHVSPVLHRGEPVGRIVLHGAPSAADPAFLDRIASILGAAYVRYSLHEGSEAELRSALARLDAIVASGELLSQLDLDHLLPKLLELATETARAEVGAIFLAGKAGLECRVEWGLPPDFLMALRDPNGAPLAERVLADGAPFLASGLPESGEVLLSDAGYCVRSLLIVPLVREKRSIGLLALANGGGAADIGPTERDLVVTIAGLAATAIENAALHRDTIEKERIREQLRVAGQIQQRLLCVTPPMHAQLEFAGWSLACDEAGGDYYDIVSLDNGRVLCVLGDVSGHGVGSALVMAMARAVVRSTAAASPDPAAVLAAVNRVLSADIEDNLFMTMCAFLVDPAAGRVEFASGGHGPSFAYRAATGQVEDLGTTGLVLGIDPSDPCTTERIDGLAPGDALLLFTDGIWEARDAGGTPLGCDALAACVREHGARGAAALAAAIRAQVDAFVADAPRRDDMTLLVARLRGSDAPDSNR